MGRGILCNEESNGKTTDMFLQIFDRIDQDSTTVEELGKSIPETGDLSID